jgi:8-oxo-dGTP pyrophosphatase MutT (NUDIX family)
VIVKHATASVFVFSRYGERWRIGLVDHPRLGRLVIPGGHVEECETPATAALREVGEETGLRVRLLEPSGGLPLPRGCLHPAAPAPWWTVEFSTEADNHLGTAHVHVDHQYVAVADDPRPASEPGHVFSWRTAGEIADLGLFHDTALQASALFGCIAEIGRH